MVELTSNLTNGSIAYDDQVIVFRCVARGTILVWESDDYIGPIADGRDLRLSFVDPPGHTESSQLVDGTIARVIDIVEDMDGTIIESELVIRASLSMRNASVTCTNNGLGRMNTTYFRKLRIIITRSELASLAHSLSTHAACMHLASEMHAHNLTGRGPLTTITKQFKLQRARAHPGRSCDSVNQLASEAHWKSCSFARKGSQEKTLKIKSPPSGKHLRATSIPKCRSFAFTSQSYVSVHFNLIFPSVLLKLLILVTARAIASCVNGLSVVTSLVQQCQERQLLSSGQMASGHLPLVQIDGQL